MSYEPIDGSQRAAARVVGFSYLFAMVVAIFAQFYVTGRLVVPDSAAETVHNILSHERLFRLGLASMFLNFLTDVALIGALYVILSRISRPLALFATIMRVVETSMGITALQNQFYVLWYLSGAPYLHAFPTDQLQVLARIPLKVYGEGFGACFVPFGIGSAVFAYLWFKSRYIPRALAVLGMIGSVLPAVSSFTFIIAPELEGNAGLVYFAPIFLFEVGMGVWLLLRGLRSPGVPEPVRAAGPAS